MPWGCWIGLKVSSFLLYFLFEKCLLNCNDFKLNRDLWDCTGMNLIISVKCALGPESLQQFLLSNIKGDMMKGNTLMKGNIIETIKHRSDFPQNTVHRPSVVSLSGVSVTCGQPWSGNIKWKFPEINSLSVLNWMLLWVTWWNLSQPCFIWNPKFEPWNLNRDLNHSFVQLTQCCMHYLPVSHVIDISMIWLTAVVTVFK